MQQVRFHPRDSQRDAIRRGGFTLLELLIVVAILAMISAMAAPQLMSLMRESSVLKEADRVRETMAEARRFAIDTGIDYEFRYEINGPSIVVLPTENELNVDDSGNSTTTEKYMRLHLELPEEFKYRLPDDQPQQSETLDSERFGELDAGTLARKSWSAPFLFHFDGTAQNLTLQVADDSRLTVDLTVRGLTGAARTSQVYQEEP